LKIYFDGASEGEPRRLMQIVHIYAKLLADDMKIELEYRGHKINEHSPMDGRVTCGIFDHSEAKFSYTLAIEEAGVELFASDYAGIRYGFATFVQILHLVSKTDEKSVPALTIRDYPDVNIRAVFQDFSGCRILNTETVCIVHI
jgi:N-acetyl-beta-hexosaminidase